MGSVRGWRLTGPLISLTVLWEIIAQTARTRVFFNRNQSSDTCSHGFDANVLLFWGFLALILSPEARMTKLTADQKPLTLWCPTFSFYLDMFWSNFSKIDQSGGCCCCFLIETSQKVTKWKSFLHLEIAEIDMGSQFWVEKNDSGHKNSFFFKVKPVFRG